MCCSRIRLGRPGQEMGRVGILEIRLFAVALSFALSFALAAASTAVDIDWVTVSGKGNPCDAKPQGCFGTVDYAYRVGKYEVTNAQYVEFLNAVATIDTNGLYSGSMGSTLGGIVRSGSASGYTYAAISGREENPVNFVSFHNTLRFSNWLHNGQPTGPQGNSTTEDGAYTITNLGMNFNQITRNINASVFLTNEDEWYKAAFYDAVTQSFFDYASDSDSQIHCATPGGAPDSANCSDALGAPSFVGAYLNSIGPNGTFDQNGNLSEWTESRYGNFSRIVRGGSFRTGAVLALSSSSRSSSTASYPGQEFVGFRVASVIPEPSTALLLGVGLLELSRRSRSSRGKGSRAARPE